ncbi:MAG: hypothetical protein M3Y09_12190 [Actinomycetota bacterium]|nr:hypothetical protein [Actinomycetota bacterium]
MSDLLAVFESDDIAADIEILDRIAAYHPDRVTILVTGDDHVLTGDGWDRSDALRDRLAVLLAAIERRTGATVVGLVGDRAQLDGWRFDRELGARPPVAA